MNRQALMYAGSVQFPLERTGERSSILVLASPNRYLIGLPAVPAPRRAITVGGYVGSIRRAPRSSRWEARYRDPLGHQRTKTFPTRVAARTFLSAVETDMARGSWYDPALSRVTFAELAQEWLASNPRKRETTRVRDGDVIRVHLVPVLGVLPAGLLRRPHVQQVVETMEAKGLRAKTIRTNYGVLRAILSWGLEHDVIHRSPCRGIRLPEPDSTPRRIASAADIERLVDAMPIDHRVTVLLGALGLRQAEVFGLRIASIDFRAP
jgi:integrase